MLTSFRHERKKIVRQRKWLGGIFCIALIMLIFRTPTQNILASFFQTIARPFWVLGDDATSVFSRFHFLLVRKQTLEQENAHLKDVIDRIALDAYSREQLRSENEALKRKFGRNSGRDLLLARVLSTPSSSPFDTLIIDVGKDMNVIPGMKIMSDGDFTLGEVSSVFNQSAVVTLYSSSGYELPALIGSSSIPVTLYGEGGGNFRVTLPKGTPVGIGDLVAIPSIAPEYVGTVEALVRPEGSSLQSLFIKWPFNINTISFVYVVTGFPVTEPQ